MIGFRVRYTRRISIYTCTAKMDHRRRHGQTLRLSLGKVPGSLTEMSPLVWCGSPGGSLERRRLTRGRAMSSQVNLFVEFPSYVLGVVARRNAQLNGAYSRCAQFFMC